MFIYKDKGEWLLERSSFSEGMLTPASLMGVFAVLFSDYVSLLSFSFLDPNQYSWGENYAGSSGLMSTSPDVYPLQRTRSGTVCACLV